MTKLVHKTKCNLVLAFKSDYFFYLTNLITSRKIFFCLLHVIDNIPLSFSKSADPLPAKKNTKIYLMDLNITPFIANLRSLRSSDNRFKPPFPAN